MYARVALVLHDGTVKLNHLLEGVETENPPKVLFRNVAICGFPVGRSERIDLHVHVKKGAIDFSKLPRQEWMQEDCPTEILTPAQEAVRDLMLGIPDRSPLDRKREQPMLDEIAAATEILSWRSWRRELTLTLQS